MNLSLVSKRVWSASTYFIPFARFRICCRQITEVHMSLDETADLWGILQDEIGELNVHA